MVEDPTHEQFFPECLQSVQRTHTGRGGKHEKEKTVVMDCPKLTIHHCFLDHSG